jgi:predicted Zn-dependent protease with MMP-like domain
MDVRRTLLAAAVALSVAIMAIILIEGGFSSNGTLRLAETVAVVFVATAAIFGAVGFVGVRMAGWSEPESEAEFERIVERSERLARDGVAADPLESEFMALDPYADEDFAELVRDALDELPDLLQRVLDTNVAVVISDDGHRRGAYGLYEGDGAHRDNVSDRITIFRDTLRRDFGHDADLLRDQVTITVRHELAHHVGFDELGVRDLGL